MLHTFDRKLESLDKYLCAEFENRFPRFERECRIDSVTRGFSVFRIRGCWIGVLDFTHGPFIESPAVPPRSFLLFHPTSPPLLPPRDQRRRKAEKNNWSLKLVSSNFLKRDEESFERNQPCAIRRKVNSTAVNYFARDSFDRESTRVLPGNCPRLVQNCVCLGEDSAKKLSQYQRFYHH